MNTHKKTGRVKQCSLFLCLMAMAALPCRAASVSFYLDQSNQLADGVNYLTVMLTESGGGVDVVVKTLDPLNDIAGDHFGIQKFGFGLSNGVFEEIANLPAGWAVEDNKRLDGFGLFNFRLQGQGWARTNELSFTVGGVSLGDFDSLFAAHIAGFEWCDGHNCETSAYFAGAMSTAPVPVPAAVWLFGSGLLGLVGIARRQRRATIIY